MLLVVYYAALCALCALGAHRLVLVWRAVRRPPQALGAWIGSQDRDPSALPRVTVQLPLFNEREVAARLIDAVSRFDYPLHLFEVQVLDDSTDDTSQRVAAAVRAARQRGVQIEQLRRPERRGYKAGALAFGLQRARGSLVAVFDADFVPGADFLRRAVEPFDDPAVGMVQARWTHLNRRRSLLTRLQAILLDGHFLVEHRARFRARCFFNFNGTAGVWRREAIEQVGGWQHDTLTEDLDLSYRSQLAGWRFVFRDDLCAPAELPATLSAFRTQQRRWTQGSTQTLRKLLPRILSAPLPISVRVEAAVHLMSNLAYPLLVLVAVTMPWASFARQRTGLEGLVALDAALLLLATGALALFYAVGQRLAGRSVLLGLVLHPAVMALGIGMSVHNAAAALRGLWVRGGEFVRTPKSGERDSQAAGPGRVDPVSSPEASCGREVSSQVLRPRIATWRSREALPKRAVNSWRPIDLTRWIGLLLGVQLVWGAAEAWRLHMYWAIPFQVLFAGGFLAVGTIQLFERAPAVARTLRSSVRRRRRQRIGAAA
jgi:cellulose synthase/poly-beta-1,6-N-acetylglucosamine synthase-like glycosyltransferase